MVLSITLSAIHSFEHKATPKKICTKHQNKPIGADLQPQRYSNIGGKYINPWNTVNAPIIRRLVKLIASPPLSISRFASSDNDCDNKKSFYFRKYAHIINVFYTSLVDVICLLAKQAAKMLVAYCRCALVPVSSIV